MVNKKIPVYGKFKDNSEVQIGNRPNNGETEQEFFERIKKENYEQMQITTNAALTEHKRECPTCKEDSRVANRQTKPLKIPNKK